MSTIIPHNETVRKAFAFILEERATDSKRSLCMLIDVAGSRFNLGPADCASLERLFSEHQAERLEKSLREHLGA